MGFLLKLRSARVSGTVHPNLVQRGFSGCGERTGVTVPQCFFLCVYADEQKRGIMGRVIFEFLII